MTHLTKLTTVMLATVALGVGIAGCQPQGDAPATDAMMDDADMSAAQEDTSAAQEDTSAAQEMAPDDVEPLSASEQEELLVGNTIIGVFEPWKLNWSEYFAPDGTAKAWLKFEGQDDLHVTGTHYTTSDDRWCNEYPEAPGQQKVFCHKLYSLGDGRYRQLNADGTAGAIYTQILPGEQIDALE